MKACSVKGCLSYDNGKRHFFYFPRRTREAVFQQWVEFCQDVTLTKLSGRVKRWVCDLHFRPQDFVNPYRIQSMAIPSLCGPPSKTKIPEPRPAVQNQPTPGIAQYETVDTGTPSAHTCESATSSTSVTFHKSVSVIPSKSTLSPSSSEILTTSAETMFHSWIPFDHSYASQGKSESADTPDLSCQSNSLSLKDNYKTCISQLSMPRKRHLYTFSKKKEIELRKLSKKYRKIKVQIHELCDSNNSITSAFESLSKHMSAVSVVFLSSYLKSSGKKPKGRKWTFEEKTLALSFYKKNPKAYILMSNFFVLPNKKTLERLIKKLPFNSGIDDKMCTTLSHVEQLNRHNKMGDVNVAETNVSSDISVETYSVSEHIELKRIPLTSHTSVLIMTSDDNNLSLESKCGKIDSAGGVMERYCRVCAAKPELTKLISIFDENGRQLDLVNKISKYLQVDIVRDEPLPQQVCANCVRKLNVFEELWQTCQKSDAKLRYMFRPKNADKMKSKKFTKSSPEEPPAPVSSVSPNNEQVKFPDSGKHEYSTRFSDNHEEGDNTEDLGVQMNKDAVLCDNCGKWFKNVANLRCHKRTHLDDSLKKKHVCTQCTKTFVSKFRLSEHMNIHKGVRPYTCTECGKKFYKRQHVQQHRQIHKADNQKVACEVCDMRFCKKSNLQRHVRRHCQDRKYKCRVCGKEFAMLNLMMSHRKMHTQQDIKQKFEEGNNIEGNVFTCEICGEVFLENSSLLLHLRTHREADEQSNEKWSCSICGKQLSARSSLQYHIKSQHSNERPWHCQYCAEGFMSKESLVAHERIHTGENPFKCTLCDKGFRTASKLTQHMLKHSEKRNFHCPHCDKRFHRKGTLTVHMRIHTGERPFICDLCGHPFIRKNDMLKHQRTHIAYPQFSCDICGLLFELKKDLTDHKEVAHGSEVDTDMLPTVFTSNDEIFSNVAHIITEDERKILLSSAETVEVNAAIV